MPKEEAYKEERSSELSSPSIFSESDHNVESEVPLCGTAHGESSSEFSLPCTCGFCAGFLMIP